MQSIAKISLDVFIAVKCFLRTTLCLLFNSNIIIYIYHVLDWGPPKSIEEYVQESERGGRDGKHAIATMFYARCDIGGAHPPSLLVISYCNKTTCRCELLILYLMLLLVTSRAPFIYAVTFVGVQVAV